MCLNFLAQGETEELARHGKKGTLRERETHHSLKYISAASAEEH